MMFINLIMYLNNHRGDYVCFMSYETLLINSAPESLPSEKF